MKLKILKIALLTLISGCSTPIKYSESIPVKVSAEFIERKSKTDANVIIVRDSGPYGSLLDFDVYIDGKLVGLLQPKQSLSFHVEEGVHIIGLGCKPCNREYRQELQITAPPSSQLYFRTYWLEGLKIQASTQISN